MFYDMTYVLEGLFWLLCRKKKEDRIARAEAGRTVRRQLQESRQKTMVSQIRTAASRDADKLLKL